MLIQRVITALVMLAVLAGSVMISPHAFVGVMTLAVAVAIWEWLRMLRFPGAAVVAALAGIACYASWLCGLKLPRTTFMLLCAADCAAWLAITAGLYRSRASGYRVPAVLQAAMAVTMLPLAWYALVWFYGIGSWPMVVSVLMIVWTADVCAYFCGRAFGRHRMAPAISPKKTWEGAAGGFAFGVAVAVALAWWNPAGAVLFQPLLAARAGLAVLVASTLALTLLSVSGDLLESAAKRQAGIKDSSGLLPGHGGFFDRLDACVPVMPAAALALLPWL